jgi:AcrR family transcriptional regulator
MGYRHTKDDILEGAIAAAFDEGLSQLTFGRLAKRLGISDRIIVYYFPTKADLIGDVLLALGSKLQAALLTTFSTPPADHVAMLRAVWPLLARPEADPVFALFFEAAGLATAGREPYRTFVPHLVDGWIDWAADHLSGTPAKRRREAAAAIATIDGLLILRQLAGPETADLAARRIGAPRTARSD